MEDNLKKKTHTHTYIYMYRASLVIQTVRNLPAVQKTWVRSLCWEDPLKKEWWPTLVFFPGEFHRQRSLVGYSPWVSWKLDSNALCVCMKIAVPW